MKNISPPLALTMGDASGIGPEIVAKVLAKGGERVVVFGSYVVMQDIVRRLGLNIEVRRIDAADAAHSGRGQLKSSRQPRLPSLHPSGRSARSPGRRPSTPSLQRSPQRSAEK